MPRDDDRRDDDERHDDLAATSESLQADAEHLTRIEEEKRDLEMDDPRLAGLSHEAEHVADDVAAKSRIERDLTRGERGQPPDRGGTPN